MNQLNEGQLLAEKEALAIPFATKQTKEGHRTHSIGSIDADQHLRKANEFSHDLLVSLRFLRKKRIHYYLLYPLWRLLSGSPRIQTITYGSSVIICAH